MVSSLLKKLQENVTQNLQSFGLFTQIDGINAKISVFRTFHAGSDCVIEENQVTGSQWFNVHFSENAVVKNNTFTAVQFSDVILIRSDFCLSRLSLTKLNNVALNESRFENNKFTRSVFSDTSLTESDFTGNIISKSTFSNMVINASRFSQLIFNNTELQNCEFDYCNLQGIEFEDCNFKECSFLKVHLVLKEPVKISGRTFHGKNISNCNSLEEFYKLLD